MIIDFHSHFLQGIDDGSKNIETSLNMLALNKANGVDICIATPHFYADRQSSEKYLEKRDKEWKALTAEVHSNMEKYPQLLLGAEVAFFNGISKAQVIERLTIGDSRVVMLEMPFIEWSDFEIDEAIELNRSYEVIIVHPERYLGIGRNKHYMKMLKENGLRFQINAEALLTKFNRFKLNSVFHGDYLLGSDSHNLDNRPPNIWKARDVLDTQTLNRIDEEGKRLIEGLLV